MPRKYRRTGKLVLTALMAGIFIAGGAYAIPDEVKGKISGITVSPTDIAITSDDRWLFVAGQQPVTEDWQINVVDTATFQVEYSITAIDEIKDIAIDGNGDYLYELEEWPLSSGYIRAYSLEELVGLGPGEGVASLYRSGSYILNERPGRIVVGSYPQDKSKQLVFVTLPDVKEVWAMKQEEILGSTSVNPVALQLGMTPRGLEYATDPRATAEPADRVLFIAMDDASVIPAVSIYSAVPDMTFEDIGRVDLTGALAGDGIKGMSINQDGTLLAVGNYTGGLLHVLEADTSNGLAYNNMTNSPVTLSGAPHDVEYYKDKDGSEHFYTAVESGSSSLVDVISLSDITAPSTSINLSVAASSISLATSTSADGYVYAAPQQSGEVFVVTSNPWIYDIEPSSSVNNGGLTNVTFKTDEGVSYWVERGGSIRENSGTKIFSSDTVTTEPEVNTFTIDGAELTEGLNDIYIFVEDADGNVGRRGFVLEKNIPPDAPDFRLGFGDSTIYVYVEALDVDDIEYYQIFYSSDINDLSDPSSSPSEKVYNVTRGEEFKHLIKGVQNGTTYYVRVRAVDSDDNEGVLSPIKSVTPQETESLVERTGESGGCAVASPGDNAGLAGELALLCIWMAGIIALRAGFGHKGGGR